MLLKTTASRLLTSTTPIAVTRTALGVGPPAFVSEWISSSSAAIVDIKAMSLSTIATNVIEAAPDSISEVQSLGEKAFAAAFLIAICQAAVAVYQYQSNPSGQLVVPPGPTQGTVMPPCSLSDAEEEESTCNNNEDNNSWFLALKELESTFSLKKQPEDEGNNTPPSEKYAATMNRISKSLVFLLPWATNVFAFVLERNVHLFHLGFIFALAQLFDVPNRLFPLPPKKTTANGVSVEPATCAVTSPEVNMPKLNAADESSSRNKPPQRILVLGDSLVAGVGSVNIYEEDEKNLKADSNTRTGPGPVFPRVLAQTLSRQTRQTVQWRSEGVVGGDTKDIEEMCLFALQEEVDKGQAPEIVVVVSGINDLKHFASNPMKYPGPQAFRNRLVSVIDKIHEISPNSKVVLPALPTQMFRRDSPLNIFPLVGFVSAIVGFWDAQKKYVAHRYSNEEVEYIGLTPSEIYQWYMTDVAEETEDNMEEIGLISADGIHPNARCYARWGESLAKKLVAAPTVAEEKGPPTNTPRDMTRGHGKSPSFVHI